MIPLRPLNPFLHADYVDVISWRPCAEPDPLPAEARANTTRLASERNSAPEGRVDRIDRELVAALWWYVLRPDKIAKQAMRHHRLKSPLTIPQATTILAAIGEAGYPIAGNGAPDYDRRADWDAPDPVRGEERDRVIWAAARHWAEMASRHITYVSLGDSRGFCPRTVQFDNPGSMHPMQQAALTLGPAADAGDACRSHAYMRAHTRQLILVREER